MELGDRWHPHDWTEEEVKRLQVQLMVNAQNNNVNASDTVKASSKTVLGDGLAKLVELYFRVSQNIVIIYLL